MPYNAPSASTIPYSANTADATYKVALPDDPDAVPRSLESQIERACEAINEANSELAKVEHQRSEALKKLAEAREKLLQKCNLAGDVLNAHEKDKTVNH